MTFTLNRAPYASVEDWAASRGQQIRDHFGITNDDLRPEGVTKPASMSDIEWNNRKILTLHPDYRDRFVAFLAAVEAEGESRETDFIVWDAVRSLERQVELYKRGRTDKGPIVTYAIATSTGHLWGLAVDLCVRSAAGQPVFELPRWYFDRILPLTAAHGLESLYLARGIDPPHVQVPRKDAPPEIVEIARAVRRDFPGLT